MRCDVSQILDIPVRGCSCNFCGPRNEERERKKSRAEAERLEPHQITIELAAELNALFKLAFDSEETIRILAKERDALQARIDVLSEGARSAKYRAQDLASGRIKA